MYQIPTNLENYSMRLSKFVESLSNAAYVNLQHLFFLRAYNSKADEKMLKILNVHLNGLMRCNKREIKEHRPYTDITFLSVVKSFIDPRFYTSEDKINQRQPEIVKVVAFLEALRNHINDISARDHSKIHQDFFIGNQQPMVDLYKTMVTHAEQYTEDLKDFRITSYEPFPHISELDPELLDMFSLMDQIL